MSWERRSGAMAGSIGAVVVCCAAAVIVCIAVIATSPSPRAELLYTGHVDMMHGANWGSTRLAQDERQHIGAALKAIDTSNALSELDAAHFGSTRLPSDSVSRQALHTKSSMFQLAGDHESSRPQFPIGRELAGELADNGAAALRTSSFKWAMDDCKAKNNCQSLLGKRLWRVLQTKAGKPNLHIFHDQDDDRRSEERTMEKDYLRASGHSNTEKGEQSAVRWAQLKQMMKRHEPLRGIPKSLQAELEQIQVEHIPRSEKRILEKSLLRSNEEARQASRDTSEYQSDTSLIYGGGHRGMSRKWREYKASMVPSRRDEAAEVREARQDMAAHASERKVLHKMESKAQSLLSKKADKAGRKKASTYAEKEEALLKEEDRSDALEHADRAEATRAKGVRRATEASEEKEMQSELASYSKPFSKQMALNTQLRQYMQQQAKKTSKQKEEETEDAVQRRLRLDAAEHAKEKRMAAAELSRYDGAYTRRPIISPPGADRSQVGAADSGGALKAPGRTMELSGVEVRRAGSACYLASGKEVACSKLSQLGRLMKEIYGKQAGDVAIVAKDRSFDPTEVLKSPPADFPAAPPAELHGEEGGVRAQKLAAESTKLAEAPAAKRKHAGASRMGMMIHKMNEEEIKPLQKGPTRPGALADLSNTLANVIGW